MKKNPAKAGERLTSAERAKIARLLATVPHARPGEFDRGALAERLRKLLPDTPPSNDTSNAPKQ